MRARFAAAAALLILGGCSTADPILTDVDPVGGNPRIVVSDVAVGVRDVDVEVTDYGSAVSPSGGLVVKQGIAGWVVMSRPHYVELLNRTHTGADVIFDIYARECRADRAPGGCNDRAAVAVRRAR